MTFWADGNGPAAQGLIEGVERAPRSLMAASFVLAAALELAILAGLSLRPFRLPVELSSERPIEAEIMSVSQVEPELHKSHLSEAKPRQAPAARPEPAKTAAIDPSADPAKKAQTKSVEMPAENQTAASSTAAASHGPIAILSPSPEIPPSLRDRDLHVSCLVEFTVAESGESVAHLISSSGDSELDSVALKTARAWRFSPAIKDNRPIASKVRLRINFEVQ